MAVSTNLGISPDETYHYNLIQLFAKNGWLPFIHNQYGMYSLGEVIRLPFILYHYLLSLPYHLFSGSGHNVEILRFINIGFSLVSIYLLIKLAERLKVSSLVRNISLFMLVNTLMFTFLSSSINYDNLLIPVSLASILVLFDVLDKPSLLNVAGLVGLVLAGMLTAINYLPIAAAIFIIFSLKYARNFKTLTQYFRRDWRSHKILNYVVIIVCLLLGLLFIQRYGLNLVKYHTYSPTCDRVNTYQQCLQNHIFSRETLPKRPVSPSTPFEFMVTWWQTMRPEIFGILGYKSIQENQIIRLWSEALILFGSVAAIRYYRPSRNWNLVLIVGLAYLSALFARNYFDYLHASYSFGIQGRYLFPFLPFFYFLVSGIILLMLKNVFLKSVFVLATILIFATASLPVYILKTTPDWHTTKTVNLNQKIKDHL